MNIKIREAIPTDFERLEKILSQNEMLSHPEIDGKEAMQRIYEKMGKYFLVALEEDYIVGLIRGVYDGSRAIIHQIAVDKKYQKKGLGKKMIQKLAMRFKSEGASSISVTVTENSKNYYKNLYFSDLSISLMVASDIDKVIEKTN